VRRRAEWILDTVRVLLDEECLTSLFDEPIAQALETFECPEGWSYSNAAFLATIARFVQHVYEHALPGRRKLSESQARDEAVALLQQVYQGTGYDGYEAAAAEAAAPDQPGVELVVATLAEALKARERQRYVAWVGARHIGLADWSTRRAMAAILLEASAEHLPPELLASQPEQVAHCVSKLLQRDMATDKALEWYAL